MELLEESILPDRLGKRQRRRYAYVEKEHVLQEPGKR